MEGSDAFEFRECVMKFVTDTSPVFDTDSDSDDSQPPSIPAQRSSPIEIALRPSVVNRYKPVSIISIRGSGLICKATDTRTKRNVAVKRMGVGMLSGAALRVMLRELKVLRHLMCHENVISINDALQPSKKENLEHAFIIFELLDINLRDLLLLGESFYKNQTKYILFQLVRGLKFIHGSGVTHRHLKPENLVLNANYKLRIANFFLACTDLMPSEAPKRTDNVGSVWYKAPEVLMRTNGAYSHPIDMWSVGCIMAQMLNKGKALFCGHSKWDQLENILSVVGPVEIEDIEKNGSTLLMERVSELNSKCGPGWSRPLETITDDDSLALDLLTRLLQFSPQRRISAEDALKHGYFAEFESVGHGVAPVVLPESDFEFESQPRDLNYMRMQLRSEIQRLSAEGDGQDIGDARAGESKVSVLQHFMKQMERLEYRLEDPSNSDAFVAKVLHGETSRAENADRSDTKRHGENVSGVRNARQRLS